MRQFRLVFLVLAALFTSLPAHAVIFDVTVSWNDGALDGTFSNGFLEISEDISPFTRTGLFGYTQPFAAGADGVVQFELDDVNGVSLSLADFVGLDPQIDFFDGEFSGWDAIATIPDGSFDILDGLGRTWDYIPAGLDRGDPGSSFGLVSMTERRVSVPEPSTVVLTLLGLLGLRLRRPKLA